MANDRLLVRSASERFDVRVTNCTARCGVVLLRVNLGIVFLWFGGLKFFPGLSPAEDLAARTMGILTFGLIPGHVCILILAAWESLIGIGLVFGICMRTTLALLFLQMAGTLTPLAFFPREVFTHFPYALSLEGQYIIKNLVLISAGVLLRATVRGGRLEATPPRLPHRPEIVLHEAVAV